ncbi:MAG: hypothetical protein ACW964_15710, partial [Candidatus Hodarchaeales archaeon]
MMYPEMNYQFPGNMVTEIPMAQQGATLNTVIKPAPPKEKSFEDRVNYYLGDPMTKARKIAEMSAEGGNDAVDNIRHPLAGMYTTEALMNKGLDPITASIGSIGLGVAHEIANPNRDKGMSWWNTIREGAEDAFNNMVGAGIGVMPGMTDAEKIQMIQRLSYANKLPDGYDIPQIKGQPKDNMYFKQFGGELELTDEEVEEYRRGGFIVEELPKAQHGRETTNSAHPFKSSSTQEERHKVLYGPVEDKIWNVLDNGTSHEMPWRNVQYFANSGFSKYNLSDSNLPPVDPILLEIQKKVKDLDIKTLKKFATTDYSKIKWYDALKMLPENISVLEALKYKNHLKKLHKQGYTFEDGGSLPKAQVGYNTPEYNEAYNQGTVTRYNPQTDTYQGQTLPTFEISAKDTRVADAVRSAT